MDVNAAKAQRRLIHLLIGGLHPSLIYAALSGLKHTPLPHPSSTHFALPAPLADICRAGFQGLAELLTPYPLRLIYDNSLAGI